MTKRAEQKEKRRQEILRAGLHVFVRKGYGAAQINDVAGAAGMSVGLLYRYFDSLEQLHEELLELALSGRTGQYFPPHDDPLDYFRKGAAHILAMVKADIFHAELFLLVSQAGRNPELPPRIKERLEQNDIMAQSLALITEGQRQGSIRRGDPAALALAFWLSVQAYVEMLAVNPNLPYPESEWFIGILRPGAVL